MTACAVDAADLAQRAWIVLLAADGAGTNEIVNLVEADGDRVEEALCSRGNRRAGGPAAIP